MQKNIKQPFSEIHATEKNSAWVSRRSHDDAARREYEQERLIVWAMEIISDLIEKKGTSKADIARKLDCSRAHVTQLLSGGRNATLKSIADLAWACDSRITLRSEPLRQGAFISSPVCLASNALNRHIVPIVDANESASLCDSTSTETEMAA